jgi:HPt (histidine-containing phosphotransfer) domain-containing protein
VVPTEPDSLLDLAHLVRQTFGDSALEREILALFDGQCARLGPLLCADGPPDARGDAAHALKGAARAVGAWRIAELAERLEAALDSLTDPSGVAAELEAAIGATRAALAARLGTPLAIGAGVA